MKIGLPQALLYYYYNPLWQRFFMYLGLDTVVSGSTTKQVIDDGVKYSVAEMCVPLKVFCGHAVKLMKSDVDYIFVPRMITVENHKHFCPKFLGLPDMLRHLLPGISDRLLAPDIRCRQESIRDFKDYRQFADKLDKSDRQVKSALMQAENDWKVFRSINREGYNINQAMAKMNGLPATLEKKSGKGRLTIGLLGYVYNIYDCYIGMDIINKLRKAGADVITFEMLDDREITSGLRQMTKSLPWTFSNKLLGAGYKFFDDSSIDGLIHITAFGCGPDSMLGKLLELTAAESDKPFMTIRVDEHSGEAHLATRVEAFMDMLKRKKYPA